MSHFTSSYDVLVVYRVKSCNFGHQVNWDMHLQTVKILTRRLATNELSHQDFHCLLI